MLTSLNRYDFQPHHFRLAHDITLDNISAVNDADAAGLVYECNKQNDAYQQQQQQRPITTTLLDKLQSRIESRNQRNAAKSKLITEAVSESHGEKAVTESVQTETPPDKKQRADARLTGVCRSPRIEDVADTGLNALSGCAGNRRRQTSDSTVICRNVELTSATKITSRLDEIRQRFKSESRCAQSSNNDHNSSGDAQSRHGNQSQLRQQNSCDAVKPPERKMKPATAARNMTLSLAEELQAAVSAESNACQHRRHHVQQQQQHLPCAVGLDDVIRCAGGGIAQFLIDVTELGSPDQVDPVNKFHGVVCDLAYGCVATNPHVEHDDNACTKSCCGADQLMLAPLTTTSGHVNDDVIVDDSDSSTLLSTSRDGSDVTVTSSCPSRAASVSGASDTGYVASDESVTRDELGGKKLSLNHFDRTASLESSRSSSPARRSLMSSPLPGNSLEFELDEVDATHRGCHRFVPRHPGELAIEISDPIYVEVEEDDLWCEGINLRTKQRGIFPTAYATDLSILDDVPRSRKFFLKFLGSIEVSYHRGNDVLCQAINKMVNARRSAAQSCQPPPPLVCLEINEVGIKMSERSQNKKSILTDESSLARKLARLLSKDQPADIDHLFSLKNICFCGYHPKNDRYLGIITKHPVAMRFACHVFQSEKSTKTIAEVIGNSFQKFYQEYLAAVHPTEDFYLE